MMAQKPLLLKDFLELTSDSCNSFASFSRTTTTTTPHSPTVRFLLESEHSCYTNGITKQVRSRSTIAKKLSSLLIKAVKNFPLPSSSSSPTMFPRCISKKLGKSFSWKTKSKKKLDTVTSVLCSDIVRLNSLDRRSLCYPSPIVSSCCSLASSFDSSSLQKSRSSSPSHPQSEETESRVIGYRECQPEEKEQQSPVSIMDFPCQHEEDDDQGEDEQNAPSSPCFEQSLVKIERTTQQLLQRIRRFETLADLDPLFLELAFHDADSHVATSEGELTAWHLIQRLRADFLVGPHSERLLTDFFTEGLCRSASVDVEGMLSVAGEWINGGGWLKKEEQGKDQLRVMERSGRWRFFEDGKDDVAADVEVGVFGSLLQELLLDVVEKMD